MAAGGERGLSPGERQWLLEQYEQDVIFDEPLNRHTSLRVGGPADALVTLNNKAELSRLIQWTGEKGLPYFVLGRGTNLVVRDKGVRGIVIRLGGVFKEIRLSRAAQGGPVISAGAAAGLASLVSFALENGLAGLNFAVGIPGAVGGAIVMNAGTHAGCVADSISAVRFITGEGREVCLAKHQAKWSHRCMDHGLASPPGRRPVVCKGLFNAVHGDRNMLEKQAKDLMDARKRTQPSGLPSAGSFFKNPPGGRSAGELIDKAGLKGLTVGGAMVSMVHANWIVNADNAKAADVLALMELVQEKVSALFGISLEPEVKIVGA